MLIYDADMRFQDRLNSRLSKIINESNDEELFGRLDKLEKMREENYKDDDPRITGWDTIGIKDPGTYSVFFEKQHPKDAWQTDIDGLRKWFIEEVPSDAKVKKISGRYSEMWRIDSDEWPEYVFIAKR